MFLTFFLSIRVLYFLKYKIRIFFQNFRVLNILNNKEYCRNFESQNRVKKYFGILIARAGRCLWSLSMNLSSRHEHRFLLRQTPPVFSFSPILDLAPPTFFSEVMFSEASNVKYWFQLIFYSFEDFYKRFFVNSSQI